MRRFLLLLLLAPLAANAQNTLEFTVGGGYTALQSATTFVRCSVGYTVSLFRSRER